MYSIYWLISENYDKTYIGFTKDIKLRLKKHKNKAVYTTRSFGKFRCFILEEVDNLAQARIREKYWKSGVGRKKLSKYFIKASSSNG